MANGSQLHVGVCWPDARTVFVDVRVEPLVGEFDAEEPQELRLERDTAVPIDDDELATPETLRAFLARLTRNEAAGAHVRAVCVEPDDRRILDLLGVTGPPPNPILVVLEHDG
jgi:hypothetical protein